LVRASSFQKTLSRDSRRTLVVLGSSLCRSGADEDFSMWFARVIFLLLALSLPLPSMAGATTRRSTNAAAGGRKRRGIVDQEQREKKKPGWDLVHLLLGC
jgi:hypothetical protein